MRTLAIGDIHGCSRLLDTLLALVQPTPDDTLVFLGDYVDRGPDSRGVIERLLKLKNEYRCVFLRGNHELMMQRSRTDASERRMWMSVGGAQTVGSYGPSPGRSGTLADVPEEHWVFFAQCVNTFETETHIFAHAGVEPETPLEEQQELWLFWEFLEKPIAHCSGKTLIVGHTSQKSGEILDYGTAICIDTYAFSGGRLTCLCAETRDYWQADVMGKTWNGVL